MTTLSRTLFIAALSVPLAASAQDQPPGSSPADPSKPDDTPKPGDTPKTSETDTTDPAKDPAKKEKLSAKELQIIAHYHQDNLMEIELGNLAKKRGTNQAVKSYGEMLVTDHSSFDKDLMALARKTGQKVPQHKPGTEAEKQEMASAKKSAADIKKLTGASFDRAYLSFMVSDHHNVLAKIDAHIAEVQHPELADMLRQVKPILERHHDQARELQQQDPQAMR